MSTHENTRRGTAMTEHVKPREWTLSPVGPVAPAGYRYVTGLGNDISTSVRVVEAEPVEQEIAELKRINEFDIGVPMQELRHALEDLAEEHHRTINSNTSTIHDPGRIESFRECPARSCRRAAEVLR